MTVNGMATATCLILVTVETFDTQIRYGCRRFFVLTFNAGPCFTSHMEPQTWPSAVIHQSSQCCCLPYLQSSKKPKSSWCCNVRCFSRLPNSMYSTSQHFQLVYFCRFATFSKARHAVIYGVGSLDDRITPNVQKHVGACEAGLQKTVVSTCNSCTSMIRFLCSDKYVNTKLLAPLDLLSNALALQNGGGLAGAQPPPFEKHGQRSEQTGFLQTLNKVVFLHRACITKQRGVGRAATPHLPNMDEDQNSISS